MAKLVPAWSDEDVEAFRDLARTFFEKECAPNEGRWAEQHHVDRDVWTRAGAIGLLGPSVPEQYGGGGGSFAHEAVLAEEQIRAGAPSSGHCRALHDRRPLRPGLRHPAAEAGLAAQALLGRDGSARSR